jgi:hypothetical protein
MTRHDFARILWLKIVENFIFLVFPTSATGNSTSMRWFAATKGTAASPSTMATNFYFFGNCGKSNFDAIIAPNIYLGKI